MFDSVLRLAGAAAEVVLVGLGIGVTDQPGPGGALLLIMKERV